MRRARIVHDGAKHHVTARANHQKLLLEHVVKQMFLDVLARAHEKFVLRRATTFT
ncbi:MAG: hypothetical protein WCG80_05565 [Spirochaetales bacterium]